MPDMELLLEAEKRGILPADKQELLAEARNRGLVPPLESVGELPKRRSYGIRAVENFPSDIYKLGKEFFQAARHPLQTGDALSSMLAGLIVKATPERFRKPGTEEKAQALEAAAQPIIEPIAKSIQEPAGVPKRALEYFAEKPAHGLLNLSMFLRGAGGLTKSKVLGEAATALDPLNMMMKTTGAVAKPLGSLGRQALGFTTGKRSPIVEQLYQTLKAGGDPADTARKYYRGKLEAEDAIGEYKGALKTVRDNQLADYRGQLQALEANPTAAIDMTELHNALTKKLYDYDVRIGKKGQLDFSRSKAFAANPQGQADVKMITEIIRGWGRKKGDNTPVMLDTLRGILSDFYSPSGKSREFATALKSIVKDKIEEKVPGYKKNMLEPFEKRQELFEDSKKLFSMKNPNDRKVNADLVLKKLQRAMTEDPDFARDFIGKIEAESGKNIKSIIAAYSMAPALPGGIVGRGMLGGSLYETARHGIAGFDPHLAIMIGMASPRVVGEFLNVAAKVTRAAGTAKKGVIATTVPRQVITQAGAATEKQEE